MLGVRACADYFSQRLGRKISRRPVITILGKIASGEVVITRDQLAAAANAHPPSASFAQLNPWIIEPEGNMPTITGDR